MSRRSPIDASQATRAAYERALSARLTATELRVFVAIAHEVTGYDRIDDRVPNRVLAELTGVHPRHVRRAVNSLVDKGIIERDVSCRNRYSASLYRFPIPVVAEDHTSPSTDAKGAEDAPEAKGAESAQEAENDEGAKGAELDSQGGNSRQPRGRPRVASEVLSEASSEERDRGREPIEKLELLVELKHEDLPRTLRKMSTKHGEVFALAAVDVLVAESAFFTWPSELEKAIDSRVAGMAPPKRKHPQCDRCVNGNIELHDGTIARCDCTHRADFAHVVYR